MEGPPQRGGTQHRLEQQLAALDIEHHDGHPSTETSYSYSYKVPTFQNAPKKFAPVTAPKPKFSGPPPPPPPKPKNRPQQQKTAGLQSYQPVNYTKPAETDDLPPPPPPPEPEAYTPHSGQSFPPPPPAQDDLPPPPPPNVSYTYTRTETQYAPQPAPQPAPASPPPPPPPPPPAPGSYEPRPSYSAMQPKYTTSQPTPATHSYTPPPPPTVSVQTHTYQTKEPQPQSQYRPQPATYTPTQTPTRDTYQRYEETPPPAPQPTNTYTPTQQHKYSPPSGSYPPPANTYAQPTSTYAHEPAERPAMQSGPGTYAVPRPSDQPLSRPDKTGTEAEVDALTNLLVQNMENSAEPDFFGMCGKCGQKVMGDENGCSAMDQIFHINCFTCVTCNGKLRGKPFYALEGKAYCEECYFATLEKCSVCYEPIMDRILRATGKPYHPRCFTCVECGKSLDGIPFTVDATNQIHCIEDFHRKFAPRCTVCQQPIMPEPGQEETVRIVAMDRSFHVSCYKCEDCGLLLSSDADGRGCYPLDDHILCRDCNARRIQTLTSRMSDQ
ncbi:uncharacterized protein LOC144451487 isoform X2 [Glandiceps talaboti]